MKTESSNKVANPLEAIRSEFETIPDTTDIGMLSIKSANRTLEDAARRPDPEQLYLELWYEGEVCCLFADSNLGKSIFAVQMLFFPQPPPPLRGSSSVIFPSLKPSLQLLSVHITHHLVTIWSQLCRTQRDRLGCRAAVSPLARQTVCAGIKSKNEEKLRVFILAFCLTCA